ncbi:MAG: High-affinity Na(+)/H(+) antiporter NhaS3 [Microgenomates bacterium OLB23]|nr:MAG: High-affinity Na(+)/H(+) antiporter NhaS3 [Microgenomates bacterium OLB23]
MLIGTGILASPTLAFAAEESAHTGSHGEFAIIFFWIALLLLAAKIGSVVERFGQPAVLGELLVGVLLGNLTLVGISYFEAVSTNTIISFMSELGVVILLFQIGLESNIAEITRVGTKSLLVAVVGVVMPFVLGTYLVGPIMLPGLNPNAYLFLGAALTATSVGITARVFKDLGALKSRESKIVLGAAVIDDVLGLIILAIVTAIVTVGSVSIFDVGIIVGKSVGFLIGSIAFGLMFAPKIGKWMAKIQTSVGMKFTLAISFGLVFAYLAQLIGLAPIIGAFAAGLVLDPIYFRHFKTSEIVHEIKEIMGELQELKSKNRERIFGALQHHELRHVEEIIEAISYFLVPLFFVHTGMQVDLTTLANPEVVFIALIVTAVAFIGKISAGAVAGNNVNKWLIGFGMVPRGEVGLIFASIGAGLGVITDDLFSVIIIMVILTTLTTPPLLSHLLKK